MTREEKIDAILRHCFKYKTCTHDKERGMCPLFLIDETEKPCFDNSVVDRNYEIISAISKLEARARERGGYVDGNEKPVP